MIDPETDSATNGTEQPVSREDVILTYRLILGREPESDAVIEQHRRQPSLRQLVRSFVGSPEFRQNNWDLFHGVTDFNSPETVEVRASPSEFRAMTGRIAETWRSLGEVKPHWSVLTNDEFLPDKIERTRSAFYSSATFDVDQLTEILRLLGRQPAEFPLVLEYGCGVGRLTNALAERFSRVIGVDISAPHLNIAREHSEGLGRGNVEYREVRIPDFGMAENFDLWYSLLVLQHNPPPITHAILSRALSLLRPGGLAVFQIPTLGKNYRFCVADYLSKPPQASFDMHAFPRREIFAIAYECGCAIRDHLDYDRTGPGWLSELFVLEKVGASPAERREFDVRGWFARLLG